MTHLIKNENGAFNEKLRIKIVSQILLALNYMHKNNLVHRDIKSDNVVYSASADADKDKLEIKLIDFGFSLQSKEGETNLKDFVGTPYYIAPEIIKSRKYGSLCDIWSLGVLTFQLISGEFPFNGRTRAELFRNITSCSYSFRARVWD